MVTERFEMRLDETLLERIDSWRREQDDTPGRSEAARRLIEEGLARHSREAVHFSDGEKMILLMMGEMYKHLSVEGESDPDFLAKVMYGGHYWAPVWRMNGIFHGYSDKQDDLRFVVDVLDMWSFIESSYNSLSKKDKEVVEREADPFGENPRFIGFDGNNETELLGIARFLINDMDRFSSFKKRELNSHCPTVEGYAGMVRIFEPIRKTLVGRGLSAKQLVEILTARRHGYE